MALVQVNLVIEQVVFKLKKVLVDKNLVSEQQVKLKVNPVLVTDYPLDGSELVKLGLVEAQNLT